MPGGYGLLYTESDGNTITAAKRNAEHLNHITNFTPQMCDDYSASVAQMQTQTDPGEVGAESVATSLAAELAAIRYVLAKLKGDTYWYPTDAMTLGGVPVGAIIAWYDFNAAVSLPGNYLYCDGSAISDAASPIDGETLPDLSNRYLVGFGTEGGGDIDSAAWATAAVGNASHQVNLAHTHTGPSHTHTGPSHTHNVAEASMAGSYCGARFFKTTYGGGTYVTLRVETSSLVGSGAVKNGALYSNAGTVNNGDDFISSAGGTGNTGAGGTGATGSGGSATQDVQPSSIRVRFIMRIK